MYYYLVSICTSKFRAEIARGCFLPSFEIEILGDFALNLLENFR